MNNYITRDLKYVIVQWGKGRAVRSADWKIRCQPPSAQAFGDCGEAAVTGLMQVLLYGTYSDSAEYLYVSHIVIHSRHVHWYCNLSPLVHWGYNSFLSAYFTRKKMRINNKLQEKDVVHAPAVIILIRPPNLKRTICPAFSFFRMTHELPAVHNISSNPYFGHFDIHHVIFILFIFFICQCLFCHFRRFSYSEDFKIEKWEVEGDSLP